MFREARRRAPHHEVFHTTLPRFSVPISSALNPNSASTSSVCSPNSGGRAAIFARCPRQRDRLADQADVTILGVRHVLRDAEMPDLGILEPTFCVVIWVRSAKNRRPLASMLDCLENQILVASPCSDLLSIFNMLRASIRELHTFYEHIFIIATFGSFATFAFAAPRSAVGACLGGCDARRRIHPHPPTETKQF
jgi:hypothetical protein